MKVTLHWDYPSERFAAKNRLGKFSGGRMVLDIKKENKSAVNTLLF